MKTELESENFDSGPVSYDGDNEEIELNFSFNVTMSLEDARILGAIPRRDMSAGDFFNAGRGKTFKDKWKITLELKDFEKKKIMRKVLRKKRYEKWKKNMKKNMKKKEKR